MPGARTEQPLVLRTVYLYLDQDDALRELAYGKGTSKNELIRQLVGIGMRHQEELELNGNGNGARNGNGRLLAAEG